MSAANWQFKDITISKGLDAELDLAAQTSYAKNYTMQWPLRRLRGRVQNQQRPQELGLDGKRLRQLSTSGATAAPLMTQLLDSFNNTDYFNGTYFGGQYGQVSNFTSAENYTLNNLGNLDDSYKTAGDTYPNLFHYVERITAGYLMNTIDFGKLHVQTGLRIEGTQMMTFGYNLTFLGKSSTTMPVCSGTTTTNCYSFTGVNNNPSYVDLLPSVQARYSLTPNSASACRLFARRCPA